MGTQLKQLIQLLQVSMQETLNALAALTDDELDEHSDHICAMDGSVRDLLTHNIDHERMHTGQVYSARYALKHMQTGEVHRLLAETLRARADLIASLIGLPDELIDVKVPDEDWTIREMVEHTIYWERHSIDDLTRRRLAGRVELQPGGLQDIVDPVYGELPRVDPADTATPTPVPDPALVRKHAHGSAAH